MKKVDFGTLFGLLVAVLGVVAQPEYANVLGPQVSAALVVAGAVIAALKGALFPAAK